MFIVLSFYENLLNDIELIVAVYQPQEQSRPEVWGLPKQLQTEYKYFIKSCLPKHC